MSASPFKSIETMVNTVASTCRESLLEESVQHNRHKEDSGVTFGTCGFMGEGT